MACNNCGNISDTCGEKIFAPCVYLEVDIPECSELSEETCLTLDEVVEDVYSLVCDLEINLDDFETNCLEYGDDLTILNILQTHNAEICEIKNNVEESLNICTIMDSNIEDCDINYDCLIGEDPCRETISITTFSDLLQVLINKICALESNM